MTDQDEERVGYEGSDLSLVVFHDRLSYELGLHLSRPSREEEVQRPYTVSDLMRLTYPAQASEYRRFAATSVESVRLGTQKLASELVQYGEPALRGSADFYERLAAARADAIAKFGQEVGDRQVRRQAEEAWQRKDYRAVIAAYAQIEGRLSRVEEERRRLAHERCGR